jgi:hypothetical protein
MDLGLAPRLLGLAPRPLGLGARAGLGLTPARARLLLSVARAGAPALTLLDGKRGGAAARELRLLASPEFASAAPCGRPGIDEMGA